MHRITKFDLREQYNEYVDPRIIDIMEEKVKKYNELANKIQRIEKLEEKPVSDSWLMDAKEDLKLRYLEILYSNPAGFNLTARMTTNYRCLKNIYIQRKNHRLPEWREFCKWIETLPYFEELINTNQNETN